MFFIKFLEYRGAKLLGIEAFKSAKRLTYIYKSVEFKRAETLKQKVNSALKEYTLNYCKLKREKAFSAMIFSEKWAQKRCFNLFKDTLNYSQQNLNLAE